MAENIEPPPRQFVDPKTGLLTEAAFRWLEGKEVGTISQIGSVLSGVSEAKAAAAAAQATANAAATGVTDVAAATLPFSASITPTPYAYGEIVGPGLVDSSSVTAVPVGGTGPYTYSHVLLDAVDIVVLSPTADTTAFESGADLLNGEIRAGTVRCTITDSLLATATVTYSVALVSIATGGG